MSISFTAGQVLTAAQLNVLVPIYKQKTGTQTVASLTLQNDTDIVLTLLPNLRYQVSFYGNAGATSGTGDIVIAWASTGTLAVVSNRSCFGPGINTTDPTATAAAATTVGITRASHHGLTTPVAYGLVIGIGTAIHEDFIVDGGVSGGTLQLQFAQNTLSGSSQLEINTYAIARALQ